MPGKGRSKGQYISRPPMLWLPCRYTALISGAWTPKLQLMLLQASALHTCTAQSSLQVQSKMLRTPCAWVQIFVWEIVSIWEIRGIFFLPPLYFPWKSVVSAPYLLWPQLVFKNPLASEKSQYVILLQDSNPGCIRHLVTTCPSMSENGTSIQLKPVPFSFMSL